MQVEFQPDSYGSLELNQDAQKGILEILAISQKRKEGSKMSDADINFGLWHGAAIRAGRAEVRADAQEELAQMWKKTARMAKDKLNSSAAEADAGLAVVDAIMKEISEIDQNPEKARFFSDPSNRLSRTNLFKKVKEEREKKYADTTLGEMPTTRVNKEPNSK